MDEEKVLRFVKKATALVVGVGVSHIVWSIVDAHTPQDKMLTQEIPVTAAKLATSWVIADMIEERTNDGIDRAWLHFKTEIQPKFKEVLDKRKG